MNTLAKLLFSTVIISVTFLSCKKDKKIGALGPGFPYAVNSIITTSILDTLKIHGLPVNDGLTPPVVNGIYLVSPTFCLFDNSPAKLAGHTIIDVNFKFYNQNAGALTLKVAYNDGPGEFGVDNNATYISGSGNLFTIFALLKDTINGAGDIQLRVLSGEVASNGIKNLTEGLYIQNIGYDPNGEVSESGTIRIFKDADGFSQAESSFLTEAKALHKAPVNKQQFNFSGAARKQGGIFR